MENVKYLVDCHENMFTVESVDSEGVSFPITYEEARKLRSETMEEETFVWSSNAIAQFVKFACNESLDFMDPVTTHGLQSVTV